MYSSMSQRFLVQSSNFLKYKGETSDGDESLEKTTPDAEIGSELE